MYREFISILILFCLLSYFVAFYFIIIRNKANQVLKLFYNAVCNIKKMDLSIEKSFEQINLNYEKICQSAKETHLNILDLLTTLVYYYDSKSDTIFKNIFNSPKDAKIRDFMMDLCTYIKLENPFISIPPKEANLLQIIRDSYNDNNSSLGINALTQLTQEIEFKEKTLVEKVKENQRSTFISIIGIFLTLFFGVLSFVKFF